MMSLKNVLIVNGASSGITGIALAVFAQFIAGLFEVSLSVVFIGTGVFLLGFATLVLFEAMRNTIRIRQVQVIIVLDTLWVISSVVLLIVAGKDISMTGNILILGVALWVALMAFLQARVVRSIEI